MSRQIQEREQLNRGKGGNEQDNQREAPEHGARSAEIQLCAAQISNWIAQSWSSALQCAAASNASDKLHCPHRSQQQPRQQNGLWAASKHLQRAATCRNDDRASALAPGPLDGQHNPWHPTEGRDMAWP